MNCTVVPRGGSPWLYLVEKIEGEWAKLHPMAWPIVLGSQGFKAFDIEKQGWILATANVGGKASAHAVWGENPQVHEMSGTVTR